MSRFPYSEFEHRRVPAGGASSAVAPAAGELSVGAIFQRPVRDPDVPDLTELALTDPRYENLAWQQRHYGDSYLFNVGYTGPDRAKLFERTVQHALEKQEVQEAKMGEVFERQQAEFQMETAATEWMSYRKGYEAMQQLARNRFEGAGGVGAAVDAAVEENLNYKFHFNVALDGGRDEKGIGFSVFNPEFLRAGLEAKSKCSLTLNELVYALGRLIEESERVVFDSDFYKNDPAGRVPEEIEQKFKNSILSLVQVIRENDPSFLEEEDFYVREKTPEYITSLIQELGLATKSIEEELEEIDAELAAGKAELAAELERTEAREDALAKYKKDHAEKVAAFIRENVLGLSEEAIAKLGDGVWDPIVLRSIIGDDAWFLANSYYEADQVPSRMYMCAPPRPRDPGKKTVSVYDIVESFPPRVRASAFDKDSDDEAYQAHGVLGNSDSSAPTAPE